MEYFIVMIMIEHVMAIYIAQYYIYDLVV